MPFTVTHFITSIISFHIITRKSKTLKKYLTPQVALVAGFFAILPDIDVVVELALFFFAGESVVVHRQFTHSLIFPALLIIPFFFLKKEKRMFAYAAAFGFASHVILDLLVGGHVPLFYPLLPTQFALNLLINPEIMSMRMIMFVLAGLDTAVFLFWLLHEEKYKKIRELF